MRTAAERFHVPILAACLGVLLSSLALPAQESGTGWLKLKVNPHRAGLFVDGKYFGPVADQGWHLKYPVPAGEHEITLSEPRYQDFTTKVTIVPGESTSLHQSLQPAAPARPPYGTLRIEGGSSRYNAIYLNGKFMGHLDEFNASNQGLQTTPGEYNLKVVGHMTGATELEQKIQIEEDKTTHLRVGSEK